MSRHTHSLATRLRRPFLAAVLMAAAAGASAQVTVKDAWVRATVPQQKATGAFMQLQSGADSRLVSVSTPQAANAEIHEMAMQGDIMRMRQVPAVELPAGKTVELKPGGHHVMLMNLKGQVKEGDTVALALTFEGRDGKRQTVEVKAPVRALNGAPRPAHGDQHQH